MERHSPGPAASTTVVVSRPRSAYPAGGRRLDSYRCWMQDYHKQNQQHRHQLHPDPTRHSTHAASLETKAPIFKDPSVPNSGRKTKGTNLFLSFNSLKVSPEDGESQETKPFHAHVESKNEIPDTLDGYRIYKGSGYLTLGVSRQNATSTTATPAGENKLANHPDKNHIVTTHTHMILPDKFVISSGKSSIQDASRTNINQNHQHDLQQTSKHASLPFHIHANQQRLSRSLSASSSSSSSQPLVPNNREKKGTKAKHSVKKVKPLPKNLYRTPTITTIQLQTSDSLATTPRQSGSVLTASPNNTEQSALSKPESCFQHPKSILKNNKSNDVSALSQSPRVNHENYFKTIPVSLDKLKHGIPYHELLVSTNRIPHANLDAAPHGVLTVQGSQPLSTVPVFQEPVRPKSAAATCSRYELLDKSSSPRRKSVTFNSYVSFLSDNRVSTIRSLPVDV